MNKAHAIKKHAKLRAKQRFNLNLTRKIYATIIRSIQNHTATYIKESHRNRQIWLVPLCSQEIKVVYDLDLQAIVTVLHCSRKDPRKRNNSLGVKRDRQGKPLGVYCKGKVRTRNFST